MKENDNDIKLGELAAGKSAGTACANVGEKYGATSCASESKPVRKKTAEQIIREKERERALKNKSAREAADFKKRYFAFYDDVKISHREDW